jgi:hypothetical protein
MTIRKTTNAQTTIYKIFHRKQKLEQHEPQLWVQDTEQLFNLYLFINVFVFVFFSVSEKKYIF